MILIHTFIIYIIFEFPNSNQFTSNNIEIDLTKNNNLLTINNRYSFNFCDLINEIKSDNDLIFIIHYCTNSYIKIGLVHSKTQSNLNHSNKFTTNIKFTYLNNKKYYHHLHEIL